VTAPPGLAVERTVLAWNRTWLTVGACGLLLLRLGEGSTSHLVGALLLGGPAMLTATAAGRRRARYLRTRAAGSPVSAGVRAAGVIAATATLLGLGTAALIVLG